jgi:predicted metalloprotease
VTDQDIAQSVDAAASVGDDRIQRQTQGYVSQMKWEVKGIREIELRLHQTGSVKQQCSTTAFRKAA